MNHILLGVSASVAIYKACDLASKLAQDGFSVRCVLTKNAAKLVNPQLFEAITGQPAHVSEWESDRRAAMDHIDLARWADMIVVAPATADFVARASHGMADDLLTTLILALEQNKPRLLCPAMNPIMLDSPAVQRNLQQMRDDGWQVQEPGEGHMACGEAGRGRLSEPQEIADRVKEILA